MGRAENHWFFLNWTWTNVFWSYRWLIHGLLETWADVIKWNHFPRYWPFVRGIHRSPVNSPHKGQWRGALMFSLICVWINGWVNNREAGDLRRHRAHYDVIVMVVILCLQRLINTAISVPLTIKNVWKLKHKVLYIPGTTMLKMHAVFHVSDRAGGAVRFLCGHHRQKGKATTGPALDGTIFAFTLIQAYLVHNISRS